MAATLENNEFPTILRCPDRVLGATEQTDFRFEEPAVDCGCPVEWQYVPGENGWNVVIYPGKSPVKYLKLRWHGPIPVVYPEYRRFGQDRFFA